MLKTLKGRLAAGASIAALAVVAASVSIAQDDRAGFETQAETEKLRVGTYEAELAFQSYHETAKFVEFVQGLEAKAMAAQQANDQQRLMEIQFEFEMRRGELLQTFETKVQKVMPEIARQNDLQVIALELVYYDPSIEPKDVTDELIRELNADAGTEPDDDDQDPDPQDEE